MKSVRYLLLFLSLFFLAGCKEEKPISEDTEKEPEIIEEHVHDLIHHEALEPTCTKSGHNEYDECRTCDYSTLTIIPPLGHSYDSGVVTKEASCTEEGIITYTCTRCGDTYTETIEKIEHEVIKQILLIASFLVFLALSFIESIIVFVIILVVEIPLFLVSRNIFLKRDIDL